jgi:cobalt-zinc-cadmium resistance protein CzcA
MALTVIFALVGSMVLSLTLMPVLASLGLSRRISDKPTIIDRWLHVFFQPLLRTGLRFPKTTLAAVAAITVVATVLGSRLGSEFIPKLGEGTIVITTIRMPGISLNESVRNDTKVQQILLEEFPDEIEQIASWAGAPEIATDQMGPEVTDVFVMLKPRSKWRRARTQEELVTAMSRVTDTLPGVRAVYTQPIEMRINEMDAGIRTDVGIKIFGDDLDQLVELGEQVADIVTSITEHRRHEGN